jgi:soluble lytic murein transglycosylase-like protein
LDLLMSNSRLASAAVTVLLVFLVSTPLVAQRRTSTNHSRYITIRTAELLSAVAERSNVPPEELARVNGLPVNTRLRKGQRILLPAAPLSSPEPAAQTGEVVGKRIVFADGATMDVDDAWKQGEIVWYRRKGTSESSDREVRKIEDRYKEVAATDKTAAIDKQATAVDKTAPVTKTVEAKALPVAASTWIYLVDGARLRVDEVREVADGAWYNRDKVTIFLDRERIARIEREQPDAATSDSVAWKQHGWSSGNASIDQLIRTNATRFQIDPYLVFLVIEQESHFRTRVVSPKGAQGLMQLMPGTARRFGVRRPFDPAENIRGGTQYLKQLLTMFNGRVDLALASYNAGEGRVLGYGNRVPPFKETRDYVKRISSRYRNHFVQKVSQPLANTPRRRQ